MWRLLARAWERVGLREHEHVCVVTVPPLYNSPADLAGRCAWAGVCG